jgi:hypothetical protein
LIKITAMAIASKDRAGPLVGLILDRAARRAPVSGRRRTHLT